MRTLVGALPAVLVLLLGACGDAEPADEPAGTIGAAGQTYSGPLFVPRSEAEHPHAGAAGNVVDCRTWGDGWGSYAAVYEGGATAENPEQALDNAHSEGLWDFAIDGLAVAKREDDRILYVIESDGVFKEALIVRNGPATEGAGGPGWYVESRARCDFAELPRSFTDSLGLQIWQDAEGRAVPTTTIESWRGPAHCSWQSMTFLYLHADGDRAFVRAPIDEVADYFDGPYVAHAKLPADAEDTGFSRNGKQLWVSNDSQRAYVGTQDDVEVWPRDVRGLGCI